jgi:hypothetical protein
MDEPHEVYEVCAAIVRTQAVGTLRELEARRRARVELRTKMLSAVDELQRSIERSDEESNR